MALIYKLTFMNGKSYIGQTSGSANRRYQAHAYAAKGGSDLPVHKAWRALGDPVMDILAECGSDVVSSAEIDAIKHHKTMLPDGYNVLAGGQVSPMLNPSVSAKVAAKKRGTRHSEESRRKMSISQSGKKHTPETIQKISQANKGKGTKVLSDETRKKMSQSHKSLWLDPGHKIKMSLSHFGKKRGPRSDDEKARISAARKGKISQDGEARRKAAQIAAVKGKTLSEEQKLRLSEIRKLWWANKRASSEAIN